MDCYWRSYFGWCAFIHPFLIVVFKSTGDPITIYLLIHTVF